MFKLRFNQQVYELGTGEYVLGRSLSADIQIVHESVSRRHARLVIEENAAYIEDIGSSNGTYLNGKLITTRTPLADGDKIHLGKALVQIEWERPSEAPTVLLTGPDTAAAAEARSPEPSPFEVPTEGLEERESPPAPARPEPVKPVETSRPAPPTPPRTAPVPEPAAPPVAAEMVRAMPRVQFELAPIGLRFLAWLLDGLILVLPLLILMAIGMFLARDAPGVSFFITLLSMFLVLVYVVGNWIYGPAVHGKTLGKRLLGLRIVTTDYETELGWGVAIIRYLAQAFVSAPCLMIGYLWALWDPKRQALHDKLAGTLVVRRPD